MHIYINLIIHHELKDIQFVSVSYVCEYRNVNKVSIERNVKSFGHLTRSDIAELYQPNLDALCSSPGWGFSLLKPSLPVFFPVLDLS